MANWIQPVILSHPLNTSCSKTIPAPLQHLPIRTFQVSSICMYTYVYIYISYYIQFLRISLARTKTLFMLWSSLDSVLDMTESKEMRATLILQLVARHDLSTMIPYVAHDVVGSCQVTTTFLPIVSMSHERKAPAWLAAAVAALPRPASESENMWKQIYTE